MANITAVEFGADTCVLARTTVAGEVVQVSQLATIDPRAFAGGNAFSSALKDARRTHKLPRRARIVVWGVPEGGKPRDRAVQPLLQPFAAAGFKVDRVVSPCNALAALARVRAPRSTGAICWLAVNTGGVAIVVVRPGTQLYAHSFTWDSNVGASGSQARLLQRYSLVSFLAPQVKRAIAEAGKQGAAVDALVTCGNLPDLRSLTMPLIEELDMEVETLDSLDGLAVKPSLVDRATELAPAIRLACCATVARAARIAGETERPHPRTVGRVLLAAAAIAAIAIAGYGWYEWRKPRATRSQPPVTGTQAPVGRAVPTPAPQPPRPDPPATAAAPAVRLPNLPAALPRVHVPARPADKPPASPAVPARLADPMPGITGIVVATGRRYVTTGDGRIVRVGDVLGRRVVVDIEPHTVVLKEPSGVQVRVGLGGRLLGVVAGK